MKILMVGLSPAYALNSAAMRTNALVKGFLELGNEVDYLTKSISNQSSDTACLHWPEGINMCYTGESEQYNEIESKRNKISTAIKKIYHLFFIYDHTYFIMKRTGKKVLPREKYDLIVSSSDPKTSHLCVEQLLKKGLKCDKWVQYWGDPMAVDITRKCIYPRWFIKLIERRILGNADKIVYVSPFTCDLQKKMFPGFSGNMHWLPIPYWCEKRYPVSDNEIFTIGYFGDYQSKVRNVRPFYNACKMLGSNIKAYIIGNSDIVLEGNRDIEVLSRRDISFYEKKVDLLICILNKSGTQIPGKLYHNAATNKPILVIADGNEKEKMKQYIGRFERFYICDNNEEDIKNMLSYIMKEDRKFNSCQQLSSRYIAKAFLDLIC